MYETTADLNEDHYYAGLDADMEMAEMRQYARESAAARAAGDCWHDGSGFMYRETAFYPEQMGMSPGQMYCCECKQVVRTEDVDCFKCGLGPIDCMGRRGLVDDHDHFVTPAMVTVCNVMDE
jgi:hypothetical protein